MKRVKLSRNGQISAFSREVSDLRAGQFTVGQHVMLAIHGECCRTSVYHEYVVTEIKPCNRFGGGRETVTFERVEKRPAKAKNEAGKKPALSPTQKQLLDVAAAFDLHWMGASAFTNDFLVKLANHRDHLRGQFAGSLKKDTEQVAFVDEMLNMVFFFREYCDIESGAKECLGNHLGVLKLLIPVFPGDFMMAAFIASRIAKHSIPGKYITGRSAADLIKFVLIDMGEI